MNSRKERILCTRSMMSSTADDKDDAHIRDDTESAYVKIFTNDIVTLEKNQMNVRVCVGGRRGGVGAIM